MQLTESQTQMAEYNAQEILASFEVNPDNNFSISLPTPKIHPSLTPYSYAGMWKDTHPVTGEVLDAE